MKKIGVVTYYNICNYGSFLQTYALQKKIESLGYKAEVLEIQFNRNIFSRIYDKSYLLFKLVRWPKYISFFLELRRMGKASIHNIDTVVKDKFKKAITQHLNVNYCDFTSIKSDAKKDEYQCFICGSDQIWSPLGMLVRKHKFLEFAPQKKRVAYAPSFGVEYVPEYNKSAFKKKLAGMTQISVRENAGKQIVENLLGVDNIPVVLDPTLLWDTDFWENRAEGIQTKENYICCYFLNEPATERVKEIQNFAKERNLEIIILPYRNAIENYERTRLIQCGPFEFLNVIRNAEFVITDSYHGTIFAIQFHKQFVAFERQHKKEVCQTSRLLTLLDGIGLEERFVLDVCKWEEVLETEIDYASVNVELEIKREKSLSYLINAIKQTENNYE